MQDTDSDELELNEFEASLQRNNRSRAFVSVITVLLILLAFYLMFRSTLDNPKTAVSRSKPQRKHSPKKQVSKKQSNTSKLRIRMIQLQKERLKAPFEKLKKLAVGKKLQSKSDWLWHHRELGQSFRMFRKKHHKLPNPSRKYIDIVPFGKFSKAQKAVLKKTSLFMSAYFCMPARIAEESRTSIPRKYMRINPHHLDVQVLTYYFLNQVLPLKMKKDSFAVIGFTTYDLWPGRGWNFLFGQASLRDKVGIWSIFRNGTLGKSKVEDQRFLERTIKIATHETGHMLGVPHCVGYECLMNGANNMQEVDQSGFASCPVCLNKIVWRTRCNLEKRTHKLLSLAKQFGLKKFAKHLQQVSEIVKHRH